MIYLSRLLLNPRSRQVQSEYRNPYEMHRTLSRAFGEGKEALSSARCLFRMEEDRDTDSFRVLVQSRTLPDWTYLAAIKGFRLEPPQVKSVDLNLPAGRRLAFRLRANPTLCHDGKRKPITEEAEQLCWLENKGNTQGFGLNRVQVTHTDVVQFRTTEGRMVTLQSVLFDGVLTITDAGLFLPAFENGIGPAKGFGFGLLSIARP